MGAWGNREQINLPSEADIAAQVAGGAALSAVLEGLLMAVEAETRGGMLASILLMDAEGKHLLHGAAPSLPDAYNEAIDGIEIGPGVGSCGTAAYLGHPVYVIDISNDPLWVNFKDLAMAHGLRACWSTPLSGKGGKILGTFAVYHRSPRTPTPDELAAIGRISSLATVAIEAAKA